MSTRKLIKLLRDRHGCEELPARAGKGSHMRIRRELEPGVWRRTTVPANRSVVTAGVISSIRRGLHLDAEHGVDDDAFFGR